ncbi:MAG: sugar phosphate isomerase/epimerase family protein [Isosphaeraceae bacterium]
MDHASTRRDWLISGSTAAAAAVLGLASTSTGAERSAREPEPDARAEGDEPFGYCLNTSTIRGHNLPIQKSAGLIARAGYTGIEPWIRELDAHVESGGSLDDLGKTFKDLGLSVESAIGFFEWVVDDDARRRKALDEARRSMELVRAIGGTRIAAPPVGATDRGDVDLNRAGERYRALLELGEEVGVVPQVEVWGFSKTLGTLAEAAYVAIAAGHANACILPDVYHLHKGGSGFRGVRQLGKESIHVFHVNDFPAQPPRAAITDADRVYPGDGVGPLAQLFQDLDANGFRGMLSLELFNRSYYQQPAEVVLETGLRKLRAAVKAAFAQAKAG